MGFSITTGLSYLFIGRLSSQILVSLFGIIAAATFTKSDFGLFQQLMSFVLVSATLARLGLDVIAQRELAKILGSKLELTFLNNKLYFVKFFLTLLVTTPVIFLLLAYFYLGENALSLFLFLFCYTVCMVMNKYAFDAILMYSLNVKSSIIFNLGLNFLKVFVILYFYLYKIADIKSILLFLFLCELLLLIIFFFYQKIYLFSIKIWKFNHFTKENIKIAWHQYGDIFFSLLSTFPIGILVLSSFADIELIASYAFIMSICIAIFSGGSTNALLEPILNSLMLNKLHNSNSNENKKIVRDILSNWTVLNIFSNMLYGASLFFLITFLNDYFLSNKYNSEVYAIFIFYLLYSLTNLIYPLASWALINKRLDLVRNSSFYSGLLNILLIIVLTKCFGLYGALIGTIIANIFRASFLYLKLKSVNIFSNIATILKTEFFTLILLSAMSITPIFIKNLITNDFYFYITGLFIITSMTYVVLKFYNKAKPRSFNYLS